MLNTESLYSVPIVQSHREPVDRVEPTLTLDSCGILPAQFFGPRGKTERLEPLTRLAFAVLVEAVQCFQRNFRATNGIRRRDFAEVERWFFGATGDGPFSFDNVCYLLDADPARLRAALRRWRPVERGSLSRRSSVRRAPVINRSAPKTSEADSG